MKIEIEKELKKGERNRRGKAAQQQWLTQP
jgi:hypothetical protein